MKKSVDVEEEVGVVEPPEVEDVQDASTAVVLEEKAERLNTLHSEIKELGQSSLTKAIVAGALAEEMKDLVGHGNWSDWIKKNLTIDQRTVNNYHSVYVADKEGRLKGVTSLSAAYDIVKSSKRGRGGNAKKPDRKALKAITFGKKTSAAINTRVEELSGKKADLLAIEVHAEKTGQVKRRLGMAFKKYGNKIKKFGLIIISVKKKAAEKKTAPAGK